MSDPDPKPVLTGKYAKGDLVLMTVLGKPVVGVILNLVGPICAYEASKVDQQEGTQIVVTLINPADILVPIVVSQGMEAMRRLIL